MRTPSILLVLLLLAAPAAADGPFTDLGYDAAVAQANETGKLLLIDFTATWCPPCKKMEHQTWPAAEVKDWIAAHAVAIQVDVDKERELAQRFGIEAIPTVVFLKDGKEVDRSSGFEDPAGLVAWGHSLLAGKSRTATMTESGQALLESDDVGARYKSARDLLQRGEHDLALQHFLWLWSHAQDTSYSAVRTSFMLADMKLLADRHEPARKAFHDILEDLQRRIDSAVLPTFEDWQDWSGMCSYFKENQRVIGWYEGHRDEAGALLAGESAIFPQRLFIGEVFDVLLEADRPVDAARLYPDVAARTRTIVAEYHQMMDMLPRMQESSRENLKDHYVRSCREDLARLHAALLSDARNEEAAAVANELLTTLDDGESRRALVEATLRLTPCRPTQLAAWLDEAERLGTGVADLRAELPAPAPAPAGN